ncbi:MAG: electron transfer flavoprotein subunit beta/FixA family protein [Candidatus Aminicenantes bacterium]|jgi:electron transfer flavoprotein beta subunit
MKIIVCIKKIPDPEIPPAKFRLDSKTMRVLPPEGIPPVINPYDEQAVELALQIKEKREGRVIVLSIDEEASPTIVKHALSMGADEGYVIADDAFKGSDSFSIAYILAQAIKKIGDADLILCGRQAADWDEGIVGAVLAETLEFPLVTLAESLEPSAEGVLVQRVLLDGRQEFSVPLPAVVTVSSEAGKPRLPSGWGIISASRMDVPVWDAAAIGVESPHVGPGASHRELVKLYIPERQRQCEIVEGETTEEAAKKLAEKLIKTGLI